MHDSNQPTDVLRAICSIPVIVAALGYFVDIYDLVLFSIVQRCPVRSLHGSLRM